MPRTAFEPARHGFHFVNGFDNTFLGFQTLPGRCGGMAYAALDYFTLRQQAPLDNARPTDPDPLSQFLYNRNLDSLTSIGPGMGVQIARVSAGDRRGVFNDSLIPGDGRAGRLKRFIDRQQPFQLGLINGTPGGGHHQVLCIGYEIQGTAIAPIVYDSNAPDVVSVLQPDVRAKTFAMTRPNGSNDGHMWVAYVVDEGYSLHATPQLTYSTGWAPCLKCKTLVRGSASCAAGGSHATSVLNLLISTRFARASVAGSGSRILPQISSVLMQNPTFALIVNRFLAGGNGRELNWWACSKCGSAFHIAPGSPRACSAGGSHQKQDVTEQFTLSHRNGTNTGVTGWKKCTKCGQIAAAEGACPGGGQHNRDGEDYSLIRF